MFPDLSIIYKKQFFYDRSEKKFFKDNIRSLINLISENEAQNISRLTLVFCSDTFIRRYNKKFLGHDYETDIITFHDTDEGGKIEGDLLISVDSVKANSEYYRVNFVNELYRVVIHGLLHLFGYKDKTKNESEKIRRRENHYLKKIKLNG